MIVNIKCINCNEILCRVKELEENKKKATKFKKRYKKSMEGTSCKYIHDYYKNL